MRVASARSSLSPLLIVALAAALLLTQAAKPSPELGLGDSLVRGMQGFNLPISFVVNHGQADESVAFASLNGGFDVFAAESGPVLALPTAGGVSYVSIGLIGGNQSAAVTPRERLPGIVNYFIGEDSSKWLTNIPTYRGVTYQSVYPGVDLAVYGNQDAQLEYDFIVAPGADPSVIAVRFGGADSVTVESDGSLTLGLASGEIRQLPPVLYQEAGDERVMVDGSYVLDDGIVGFAIGEYDESQPLVIDPVLVWSSFLGGAGNDAAHGVAVDGDGNVYVTGETQSTDFPTTSGAYNEAFTGNTNTPDAFVTKINPEGTAILYSTYLGGDGGDRGFDIEVDDEGQAFVAGTAGSNFPVTGGAYSASGGGFVTKLSADGSALIYSTKLGSNTEAFGLEIDGAGQAYFAGFALQSTATGFKATAGAFQEALNGNGDGIVGVLTDDGSALVWGSFIGGTGREFAYDVARDGDGYVYITGMTPSEDFPTVNAEDTTLAGLRDAFVAKIMPDGSALMYSTYLGGSGGALSDQGYGIAADDAGNAYVTGYTNSSTDFPITNGAYQGAYGGNTDAFVTKYDADGDMVYSTFLGGSNVDEGAGIEVGSDGSVYVAGRTVSSNFPMVGQIQGDSAGSDAYVSHLNANGSALIFSTYIGGGDTDAINLEGGALAVEDDGTMYVVGETESADFPTTNGAFQAGSGNVGVQGGFGGAQDGFVVKIGDVSLSGDIDCSDVVDPIDALKILRADAGLSNPAVANCPDIGDLALINGVQRIWGDLNCSGAVDPVDSLILLRYDAGLSINVPAGCPQLGDIITVEAV
ncbi:MAG TPA: SBBP repeat-containing protein [Dehalococcoidia bacterium]|nr:SBBP repeat-containing protein [Dehalococcoidia bacterium]